MFRTFDEYLRFTYGDEHWQSSTRIVFSSSPNDFKYKNYHKKLNIYDDDHNIVGPVQPRGTQQKRRFQRPASVARGVLQPRRRQPVRTERLVSQLGPGTAHAGCGYRENAGYSNKQREQTLRGVLSWDHVRKNWKMGVKAGYIHTWMAYDYEKDKGNGEWEKMIRSRSRINTFYAQAEGEYSIGRKLLVTATLSAHQHLVHTKDKNVLDSLSAQHLGQMPPAEGGDVKLAAVGYDEGRIELEGCVSVKWRPWERLGLALTLREQMYGSKWTPVIPAFFADVVLSKKGNVIAKASISRNYRFPTLNDLYFLPGGNINLKKEHGFTYDGGVEFTVGRKNSYSLHGEATWFDSYIDDWIVWLPTFKGFWSPSNIKRGARLRHRTERQSRLARSDRLALTAEREFLVDSLHQPRRSGQLGRRFHRQTTRLRSEIFGRSQCTIRLEDMVAGLQMVPLQRTFHHIEQRDQNQNLPDIALFYERCYAGKTLRSPLGELFGQGACQKHLRRGVSIGTPASDAGHQLRTFP